MELTDSSKYIFHWHTKDIWACVHSIDKCCHFEKSFLSIHSFHKVVFCPSLSDIMSSKLCGSAWITISGSMPFWRSVPRTRKTQIIIALPLIFLSISKFFCKDGPGDTITPGMPSNLPCSAKFVDNVLDY